MLGSKHDVVLKRTDYKTTDKDHGCRITARLFVDDSGNGFIVGMEKNTFVGELVAPDLHDQKLWGRAPWS